MDWNKYFDAIWCINFASYTERKTNIIKEFDRVGILSHKNFNFNYTFGNLFERIVFDTTKKLKKNECDKFQELNLTLGHYSCIKSSYEMGADRILIFEDDVKLMNDIGKIEYYVKRIPSDADVVLFSQNPGNDDSIKRYISDDRSSSYFIKYDYTIWDAGFYMLSRKALKEIIMSIESFIYPADYYTSSLLKSDILNYYYSSEPLGIQLDYKNSTNMSHFYTYSNMRLNLEDYGVKYSSNDKKYFFKIIIPVYNASNTIKRCIDSIKSQEYDDYFVILVDDMSTDDSVSIISKEIKGNDKFKLIVSNKKTYAGGARNIGIDYDIKSDYTLFLDADDYYYSKYVLESINDKIIEKNDPDCILCPFIDKFNKDNILWLRYDNIEHFMSENPIYAPWTKCIKSSLVCKFDDTVSAYDDVVQHFRQMDSVKTISYLRNIAINYCCDGKETVWHDNNISEEKQNRLDTSLVKTITNLLNEKYEHEYVKKAVFNKFIDVNIKKAIEIKNRLKI